MNYPETNPPGNKKSLWLIKMCLKNGYGLPMMMDDKRYACICPMAFNDTIIVGQYGDDSGWDEQYWYEQGHAIRAMAEWCSRDFKGEPVGWHRHIPSHRRREGGDPKKQEIRP